MHFLIRFEKQTSRKGYCDSYPDIKNVIRSGDTIIFRGEEPLARSEFWEIVDNLTPRGVDIIFETLGANFNKPENLSYILSKCKVKDVLIKLYSLSFPINDKFFSSNGISIKTLLGLENLLRVGFKNISLLTYINGPGFLNRVKSIYDYKREKGLKYLYLELDKQLSIEKRVSILRDVFDRFGAADDIIVRNNDFEIVLGDIRGNKTEIQSDLESGTLNLVIRNFCTNHCTFCTTRIVQRANNKPLPFDSKDMVIELIKSRLKRIRERNLFEIVAVEPLEHPDILEILSFVNSLSFQRIRLFTHGRPLRDIEIVRKLKELKVKEIIIPITFYSPDSALVNVGDIMAFYDFQTMLSNIKRERDMEFVFNIIISKHNYRDIVNIVDFLRANGIRDIRFTLALPSIEDERFFVPYSIKFTDLMEEITRISDSRLQNNILLSLSYIVPPCILHKYFGEDIIENIRMRGFGKIGMFISSKRRFSQYKSTSRCKNSSICKFGKFCVGVNRIYTKVYGDDEFEVKK